MISLGQAYQDNQAVLKYQLEVQGLKVAEKLVQHAPRPVVVYTQADGGGSSALSTLVVAQILPAIFKEAHENGHPIQLPAWGGAKQE